MVMDATVTQIGTVVVAALRTAGYKESTIGQYQKTISALRDFVEERGGVFTSALGAEFAGMTTSPRTGRFSAQRRFDYGRLVNVFESYLRLGRVDLAVRKRGGGGRQPASGQFIALNASWEAAMVQRGLVPATRAAYGRVARNYLVFLEDRGIYSLDDADAASVIEFLESLLATWAKSSLFWVVSNLRPFVKFTDRHDLIDALNLTGVKRSHAILPILGEGNEQLVVHACASGMVSARNASITLLALTTGLRACDIIDLRLADIDWRTQTIGIVQQKTKNPLTLPVPGLLVGTLARYVLEERPRVEDNHVFLRSVAPHTQLCDHASIYTVTVNTFRAAGVTEVKAGTRFLRHNAASCMVRAAVPLATISAVLGHSSQESTNLYMSVDEKRLRECVLPVPAGARP